MGPLQGREHFEQALGVGALQTTLKEWPITYLVGTWQNMRRGPMEEETRLEGSMKASERRAQAHRRWLVVYI